MQVTHVQHISTFSLINLAYLETDIPPNERLTITCNPPSALTLEGWSQSPGGSDTTAALLPVDTLPSKYMVSGNTLTISNINSTDEGLYRCDYNQDQTTPELCIYVYGEFGLKQ